MIEAAAGASSFESRAVRLCWSIAS
jgi:hypothetical protein